MDSYNSTIPSAIKTMLHHAAGCSVSMNEAQAAVHVVAHNADMVRVAVEAKNEHITDSRGAVQGWTQGRLYSALQAVFVRLAPVYADVRKIGPQVLVCDQGEAGAVQANRRAPAMAKRDPEVATGRRYQWVHGTTC